VHSVLSGTSALAMRGAEFVLTSGAGTGHVPAETARTSTGFTIFEGTSEIQRMIIGRAVTGLDVR
jgi:alkylation response protein AidB-like acyl-CoA dehydrogenase